MRRATSSSTGAATPMLAYVGSTATISEPKHIMSTAIIIECAPAARSAMRPKSQLPIGRMRSPAAKTPAVVQELGGRVVRRGRTRSRSRAR